MVGGGLGSHAIHAEEASGGCLRAATWGAHAFLPTGRATCAAMHKVVTPRRCATPNRPAPHMQPHPSAGAAGAAAHPVQAAAPPGRAVAVHGAANGAAQQLAAELGLWMTASTIRAPG